MNTKTVANKSAPSTQEICIDLPGESVRCWRSADHVKVILRKHRDVFFDINIKDGATYTVESTSDYYSPREKKLQRKSQFQDGERFHLWVGRKFKGSLVLKSGGAVMGIFAPIELDRSDYDTNPKTKPEPLMVVMGKRDLSSSFVCNVNDRYGLSQANQKLYSVLDPKLSGLKNFGSEFDYKNLFETPEVGEYVAVTEALVEEIHPQVIAQLDSVAGIEGTIDQIFVPPKKQAKASGLYSAIAAAVGFISGNEIINSNIFKEGVGYLQEHWKTLNKITMKVRIEKRIVGHYRVIFKGVPLTKKIAQLAGLKANSKIIHKIAKVGSESSSFIDGGYARTGSSGFGGFKRIMLTSAENFRGGLKMQGLGTIIDIIGDVGTVYFTEKGSKDLSEFLGRAGVSLVKAGATAALGSFFAAAFTAGGLFLMGTTALPVILAVVVVVVGFFAAAYVVDMIDSHFDIKETVAKWAN